MPSFANSALRLLRRVLGSPVRTGGPFGGEPTSLDGNTAVALAEAAIADAAGLGASFPADTADIAWRSVLRRGRGNLLGNALTGVSAEGPRGALAAAVGLAMGGSRATCFLSGPDLAGALDLLRSAAGRRLPLVLHLANRALPAHGLAAGSGHEALHLAADSGALVLVAANVQEAVDFGLIGRRVAEATLTPVLVAMDGEETALSMQDVCLPGLSSAPASSVGPTTPSPPPTPPNSSCSASSAAASRSVTTSTTPSCRARCNPARAGDWARRRRRPGSTARSTTACSRP